MKILEWLTDAFINTFGITPPRPDQRRLANLAIGGFLLGFILFVTGVTAFLLMHIRR